jgi:colanic acid biosynthesis glycosyl transferase WcaI
VRVLFINQFFYPDVAATAQLLTDAAEDLAASGVEVTVVTGRWSYSDGRALGPALEMYRGVRIRRVQGVALRRNAVWSRYLSYAAFWIAAGANCAALPRHDVVVPLTTPPLLSCLGAVVKRVRGSRLVCWSMDVYPELGVLLGALREGSVTVRILGRLMSWSLRSADLVIALGEHMAGRLTMKGVGRERIRVLPTWENATEIVPAPRSGNPFRAAHGLGDRFVVLYSGNLGAAHDFATLLDAAETLSDRPDIVFLIIGSGPRLPWVQTEAERRNLGNVRFLPYQPRDTLCRSLSAGDVHIVTLREGLQGLLVPSKFVGALASGRPLLYVGPRDGEIPDAIRAGECGCVIEPGDATALAEVIVALQADEAKREIMGKNARMLFERRYTREKAVADFCRILREVHYNARENASSGVTSTAKTPKTP